MTKNDLKTGMLFECKNGRVFMYINGVGVSVGEENYFDLSSHSEDMSFYNSGWDIVKVSKILTTLKLLPKYWTKETIDRNLLWERKPIETIKIGENTYNKAEFEEAVKNLKTINK